MHAAASVPRRFLLGFVDAIMNLRSRGEMSSTEYAFLNGLMEKTRGAVIGTVELCGCVPVESIRDKISATERAFGDYSNGRWAWELKSPFVLSKPQPAKGKQGWWNFYFERM